MGAWSEGCTRRPAALWATVLAGILGAGLFAFALLGHPIELPFSAERDDYLGGAAAILDGSLPHDPFRPMFYPLSVAGVALLVGGDCFLAARIVSVLAATGIVLATFALGRRLAGRACGLLAALVVGASGSWWTVGVQATTDVLFALTFALTILASLRALRSPAACAAVVCGLSLALGYFTRYTAAALLIAVLPAVWLGARRGERWRRIGWLLLGTCAGLLPHVVLTWRAFGRPFHDESWRSMAFRHFAGEDWKRLYSDEFDGLTSVLLHDPPVLLSNSLETFQELARRGLWRLLVDAPHAVAFAPLVLLGAFLCARQRPAQSRIVGAAALGYVGVLSATFFAWERLLFPLLPLLAVALACAVVRSARCVARLCAPSSEAPFVGAAGLATIAVLAVSLPARLERFAALHPLAELTAAKGLLERHGRDTVLVSSWWAMGRHVPSIGLPIDVADSVSALVQETTSVLLHHRVDYLVVGRKSLRESTFADLGHAVLPRHLRLEHEDPDVRVYRVVPVPLEEIASVPRAIERRTGSYSIEFDLAADVPPDVEVWAWLLGPQGQSLRLAFEARDGGSGRALPLNLEHAPGTWNLTPFLAHPDGTYYVGGTLALTSGAR